MSLVGEWVEEHRQEAQCLLDEGKVGDLEFSGGTYQVQVEPTEDEEYWPFIQFDELARVSDAFCSCEAADEGRHCAHLAAAVLRIYNGNELPLHVRFGPSLWNCLCQLFGERQGYDEKMLHRESVGCYGLDSVTGKRLFSLEATGQAVVHLETLVDKRVSETEETSLKFSGLSYEELTLWREGRPSTELLYELSFWSDLAKWWMILQDQGVAYEISFGYGQSGLPNEVRIQFEQIRASFYLSEANLPLIISSLSTVVSPLKVHAFTSTALKCVRYDREEGTFTLEVSENEKVRRGLLTEEQHQRSHVDHIEVGNWLFFPEEGFYSKEQHSLLAAQKVAPEYVGGVLDDHAKTIGEHLEGETIHSTLIAPSYEVWFDKAWNLHLGAYLFTPRDLQQGQSRFFGNWAYLDDVGFYPLEDPRFAEVEEVIVADQVSDFVHRHRVWLNDQPGFGTHLTRVEARLAYSFDREKGIQFISQVSLPGGPEKTRDFGDWVYVEGQGFYAKAGRRMGAATAPGKVVPIEEIPLFIRLHREELELVRGFFAPRCPIVSGVLDIALVGKKQMRVKPHYELYPEFESPTVEFLGEYVYVAGEGFSEIPKRLLLPERFREVVTLKGQELELFLTYEMENLAPYLGKIDKRLKPAKDVKLVITDAQRSRRVRGTLSLNLEYATSAGKVSLTEVWRALNRRERYLFSKAGLFDLRDNRFDWLRRFNPARVDRSNNVVQISTMEFIRLNAIETLECRAEAKEALELIESFTSFQAPEPPDLSGLQSTLRPYQEVGVNWLWFLYSQQLSGLLCDDMGLGKTHQAMALLAAVNNVFRPLPPEEQPQYLVVCPTSVIYHWKEKLARFLPDLRVYAFYGADRSIEELFDYDVVITSYGTLRSEKQQLSRIHFEVAVFDEIQAAKNVSSQTHRAVLGVKAHMRLGLTGTPIENTLRELKALFNIVLPTYLPSDAHFREAFINPIEREGDVKKRALLRRVISPFVLRRKKEDVLTELPEKVVEKSHCDLSALQRKLYNETLERSREEFLRDLADKGKQIPYMHIFAMLTALKRICDHPAVFLKQPKQYRKYASGKWDLFVELLNQAQESEQKVVVFSQYLDMLDIIEHYLTDSHIGYAAIRGSTTNREKQIHRFQTDEKCRVFVGSLQAAGVGIDLTAGSVVIHYDRWWTKAREQQATDRVHRIGQEVGVQVFKLLTVGTVEERIDTIIESKGQLLEEVVGTDEKGQLKAFSREELAELLAFLPRS